MFQKIAEESPEVQEKERLYNQIDLNIHSFWFARYYEESRCARKILQYFYRLSQLNKPINPTIAEIEKFTKYSSRQIQRFIKENREGKKRFFQVKHFYSEGSQGANLYRLNSSFYETMEWMEQTAKLNLSRAKAKRGTHVS